MPGRNAELDERAEELEQTRAEIDALREEHARTVERLRMLETAVDHLQEIVFITEAWPRDEHGRRIVYVNRTFTKVTGHPKEDVLGKNPSITIGENTDRVTLKRIESHLREGKPVHEELLKYRKDGSSFWVAIDILPVKDQAGAHTHWLSVQRDITEWRAIQARMIESERLASLGTLSAGIAHEIKNPLGYVSLNLEFARRKLDQLLAELGKGAPDAAKAKALAERLVPILENAQDGEEKVREIALDLKLLSRGVDGSAPPVDVHRVLDAAVRIVHAQIRGCARLEREEAAIPPVRAHATRLGQVFINLLVNAVEAFSASQKSNVIRVRTLAREGAVEIAIEDNGPGIPDSVRARLFEPFFTTKEAGKGTGLGLLISRTIVESLGGTLEVESTVGIGTTFRVVLPSAELSEIEATEPDSEQMPRLRS